MDERLSIHQRSNLKPTLAFATYPVTVLLSPRGACQNNSVNVTFQKVPIYVHYHISGSSECDLAPILLPTYCLPIGMVNFNNPAVEVQDYLASVKLWHTVGGLYIWEYVTTLEFEWKVFRGQIPYRRTIWIYSLARLAALVTVLFDFFLLDSAYHINCQVAISFATVFAFLTMSASSLLIVLRIMAVWKKNIVATAMAVSLWGTNAAFFIYFVARLRSTWIPIQQTCAETNLPSSKLNLIAIPVTDISLLLMVLVGLLRLRGEGLGIFGVVRVLWRQGIIWLLLALAAEVPPMVFIILNLNVPFDYMFDLPAWVTMAIASTRMYRSLSDFATKTTDVFSSHGMLHNSNLPVQETKPINATPVQMDRMEVAVRIASEEHGTLHTRDDSLSSNADEQMHGKPHGLRFDDDVERGV